MIEAKSSRNIEKHVEHFGISINSEKKYLKINREDYTKIDKKNHFLSECKKRHQRIL